MNIFEKLIWQKLKFFQNSRYFKRLHGSFFTNDQVVDIALFVGKLNLTDGHVFARFWEVAVARKGAVDTRGAGFTPVSHNLPGAVAITSAKGEVRQERLVNGSPGVSPVPIAP